LREPLVPNDVISIVHLCSNKDRPTPVPCSDGITRSMGLNYANIQRRGRV
jgi:hypothetical protein